MNKLDKMMTELLLAEKQYIKKKEQYKDEYWEHSIKNGGVQVIKNFKYARPLVTFNGKWDKEKFIKLDKPISTKFVEINDTIHYADLYSINVSRDLYSYELYNKKEYLYKKIKM